MSYAIVCDAVKSVKQKHCESDPFRLCREMGIKLIPYSFGTEPDAIKGFYSENFRIRTIIFNSDLPKVIQKIIVAHELGHAVLHRKSGFQGFHDYALFNDCVNTEKEANLFAAEFLLEDEDVLEALNMGTTFSSAAAALSVPMELLDFKFRILKWRGYKLVEPPISAQSNFLATIEVPDDEGCYGV